MKASELRIGNIVQTSTHIQDIKLPVVPVTIVVIEVRFLNVCSVRLDQYSDRRLKDWRSIDYDLIEPIPLTEEWLLKLGFTRHHQDYFNNIIFIKNVLSPHKLEWGIYHSEKESGNLMSTCKPLEHVHQLQNLYFALTGEELTIKEYETRQA